MNKLRNVTSNKFRLTLKKAPAPEINQVISLEKWRALFFKLNLVGEYPNEKIGYGDLSSRLGKKSFLITGSQTGHLAHLQAHHYTKVIECDLKKGQVGAEGLIPPSSTCLGHYCFYEANPNIQSVFNVHHHRLWETLQVDPNNIFPKEMVLGSSEMNSYLADFLKEKSTGFLITNVSEDGIFSFASSIEDAGKNLLDLYRKMAIRQ